MKTNYNFAKLNNHVPTYAHSPLQVVTHHHEEYDVDIIDEETGEPTGEKEHIVNDWDTYRTEIHPTAADYAQMGWLPVVDKAPTPEPGYYVHKTGLADEVDGRIVMRYEQLPIPVVHRTFSKLKIVGALTQAGLWTQVKSYIEQAGLYDLYLAAQNFREDNEYFKEGLSTLQAQLGLSDEKVEEILNKCIAERY